MCGAVRVQHFIFCAWFSHYKSDSVTHCCVNRIPIAIDSYWLAQLKSSMKDKYECINSLFSKLICTSYALYVWLIHFAFIVRRGSAHSVSWLVSFQFRKKERKKSINTISFCWRESWKVVYRQITKWFIPILQTRFQFKNRHWRSWDHREDRY